MFRTQSKAGSANKVRPARNLNNNLSDKHKETEAHHAAQA
jgi:hypothetical protein